MAKKISERQLHAWNTNYGIIKKYYEENYKANGYDTAIHWLIANQKRYANKEFDINEEFQDMFNEMLALKYNVKQVMEYTELVRFFKRVNSMEKHLLSGRERYLYSYYHVMIYQRRGVDLTDTQKTYLQEIDKEIQDKWNKKIKGEEVLEIYEFVLQFLHESGDLITLKKMHPDIYRRYKAISSSKKIYKDTEQKQQCISLGRKIKKINSEMKEPGSHVEERRKAHLALQAFEKTLDFYREGGESLFRENPRLYRSFVLAQRNMEEMDPKLRQKAAALLEEINKWR